MADQRARRLERDAYPGSLSDQVVLLHQRVLQGQLSQREVELASWCGDPAARLAQGCDDLEQDCCRDFGAGCKLRRAGEHDAADRCCTGSYMVHWGLGVQRRWGLRAWVMVVSAVARRVQVHTCYDHDPACTRTRCRPILDVIEAAEQWAQDYGALTRANRWTHALNHYYRRAPAPVSAWTPHPPTWRAVYGRELLAAVDELGERQVRAAIEQFGARVLQEGARWLTE